MMKIDNVLIVDDKIIKKGDFIEFTIKYADIFEEGDWKFGVKKSIYNKFQGKIIRINKETERIVIDVSEQYKCCVFDVRMYDVFSIKSLK